MKANGEGNIGKLAEQELTDARTGELKPLKMCEVKRYTDLAEKMKSFLNIRILNEHSKNGFNLTDKDTLYYRTSKNEGMLNSLNGLTKILYNIFSTKNPIKENRVNCITNSIKLILGNKEVKSDVGERALKLMFDELSKSGNAPKEIFEEFHGNDSWMADAYIMRAEYLLKSEQMPQGDIQQPEQESNEISSNIVNEPKEKSLPPAQTRAEQSLQRHLPSFFDESISNSNTLSIYCTFLKQKVNEYSKEAPDKFEKAMVKTFSAQNDFENKLKTSDSNNERMNILWVIRTELEKAYNEVCAEEEQVAPKGEEDSQNLIDELPKENDNPNGEENSTIRLNFAPSMVVEPKVEEDSAIQLKNAPSMIEESDDSAEKVGNKGATGNLEIQDMKEILEIENEIDLQSYVMKKGLPNLYSYSNFNYQTLSEPFLIKIEDELWKMKQQSPEKFSTTLKNIKNSTEYTNLRDKRILSPAALNKNKGAEIKAITNNFKDLLKSHFNVITVETTKTETDSSSLEIVTYKVFSFQDAGENPKE